MDRKGHHQGRPSHAATAACRTRTARRLLLTGATWIFLLGTPHATHAQRLPAPDGAAPQSLDYLPTAAKNAARDAVVRAETLFAAGNYSAALDGFLAAYDELTGDPRRFIVLSNVAVCYERLFQYDEAVLFYRRYLDEGGARVDDRAEVERIIETLTGLLGRVRVTSNVPGEIWVGSRRVGQAPGLIAVPSGIQPFELRAPGFSSQLKTVRVTVGQQAHVHFELVQLSPVAGVSPAYFYVGLGVTAVAALTGTQFGLRALSEASDLRHRSPLIDNHAQRQTIDNLSLAADVSYATAGLLAVGTLVMYLLTDWSEEQTHMQTSQLQLGTTAGGLGMSARLLWR